jgi:hypothetical protein
MSIISTRTVVKITKEITKEVELDDGTTIKWIKRIKTKKVKKSICLPQGIWDNIKEYAGFSVNYVEVMTEMMDLQDFDYIFLTGSRLCHIPPNIRKWISEMRDHDDFLLVDCDIKITRLQNYYGGCPSQKERVKNNLWTFDVPACLDKPAMRFTIDSIYADKFTYKFGGEQKVFEIDGEISQIPITTYLNHYLHSTQKKVYRPLLLKYGEIKSCCCFKCYVNKTPKSTYEISD